MFSCFTKCCTPKKSSITKEDLNIVLDALSPPVYPGKGFRELVEIISNMGVTINKETSHPIRKISPTVLEVFDIPDPGRYFKVFTKVRSDLNKATISNETIKSDQSQYTSSV